MGSGDVYGRLFKQWSSVSKMVVEGTRDPEEVSTVLQQIISRRSRGEVAATRIRKERVKSPQIITASKTAEFVQLDPRVQYERVYQEIVGKKVDLAGIIIPEKPADLACWPIICTPDAPLNDFWTGLKRNFDCHSVSGDDLEAALDWEKEERSYRKDPYAIWVKANVEADEDLKNVSADVIRQKQIKTNTLPERIYLEGFYWYLTGGKQGGQHLDINNFSLCSGSRGRNGFVPGVRWRGELSVVWFDSWDAHPRLRARAVVSQ